MPKGESASMDTVKEAQRVLGDHRAHEVLWQAQQYWLAMEQFRTDRERNKNYNAPPKTDRFGAQDSNQKTLCRHGQQLKKTTWSGVQGQGGS